jgi:hypothetical protein
VPAGSAAKAASVGANTVTGPSPLSVSTKPTALTTATKVLKLPLDTAISTMSGFFYYRSASRRSGYAKGKNCRFNSKTTVYWLSFHVPVNHVVTAPKLDWLSFYNDFMFCIIMIR